MITGVTPKLILGIDENGNMTLDENQAELLGLIERETNWKLVRERDGLTNQSKEVMWLEWNEEGRFKAKHDKPAIGRSLIMSPFNQFFTWQTTSVTEIVEERDDYVKFHTQNSTYELFKIND
jgi:YD repeat-containing protein